MSSVSRGGLGIPAVYRSRLLMLPVLALLLALCGGSSVPNANGSAAVRLATAPAATPGASVPSNTAALVPQTRLSLADAWGAVTIHQLPIRIDEQHVFVFENAATPDGKWLLGSVEPRDFINNTTELSALSLYNVTTRQLTRIHPLLRPQSQIIGASVDDSWIVWSEADDQPNFFDWTMFAYNRQTGSIKQLAQAVTANGRPVSGPSPMPIVDHDRVVWGQGIGPVSQNTIANAVVRMADLTTGQVTTLATKAGSPIYQWPWVVWDQVTGSGDNGYENVKNVQTGQALQLPIQAASLALAGNSVAYNDSSVARAYLIDDVTQSPPAAKLLLDFSNASAPDHVQFLSLSDRLVAWTEDSDTEVYDRARQVFVRLPVSLGASGSWAGGHTLVWMDPEPAEQAQQDVKNNLIPTGTLDVVDTLTLPAKTAHG